MREFFRGWKRKVGCVTLVLACAFGAGLERARTIDDRLLAKVGDVHYCLLSHDAQLRLTRYICNDPPPVSNWEIRRSNTGGHTDVVAEAPINWQTHSEWFGFELGHGRFRGDTVPLVAIAVPYWVAIPLMLVSAWLLLSKPRQPKLRKEPPV